MLYFCQILYRMELLSYHFPNETEKKIEYLCSTTVALHGRKRNAYPWEGKLYSWNNRWLRACHRIPPAKTCHLCGATDNEFAYAFRYLFPLYTSNDIRKGQQYSTRGFTVLVPLCLSRSGVCAHSRFIIAGVTVSMCCYHTKQSRLTFSHFTVIVSAHTNTHIFICAVHGVKACLLWNPWQPPIATWRVCWRRSTATYIATNASTSPSPSTLYYILLPMIGTEKDVLSISFSFLSLVVPASKHSQRPFRGRLQNIRSFLSVCVCVVAGWLAGCLSDCVKPIVSATDIRTRRTWMANYPVNVTQRR